MQDRFKFKGKRLDNGKWVCGSLIDKPTGCVVEQMAVYYNEKGNTYINQLHSVDIKTVCQCTGLKDIKGNLIFEGDIVDRLGTRMVIGYLSGMFITLYDDGNYYPIFGDVEIIGNFYDNPELLNQEEQ